MKSKIFYLIIFILFIVVIASCDFFDSDDNNISSKTASIIIYDTTPTLIPTQTIMPTQTISPTLEPTTKPTNKPTIKPSSNPTVKPDNTPSQDKLLSGLKICIDPGHQLKGNYDKELCAPWSDTLKSKVTSGTTGNFVGTDEYIINLQIAQKIKDKLVSLGANVLMIRESHDVDISNKERAEMSNDFGADITLRIHCNSADSSSAEGIDLYVRGSGDGSEEYKKQSDIDYNIATEMLEYICNSTKAKKRYVNKSDIYTGINWCKNTCIIIECGFMSNEKEDRLLNSQEYQHKIAEGITNYFVSTKQ